MPVHDWTRVPAGIFHAFHHSWVEEISRNLNAVLPADYYALAEQFAGGFGPDVLTLNYDAPADGPTAGASPSGGGTATAPPRLKPAAEAELAFLLRKVKRVAVRHVSDDAVVAMVEIVSPGNKNSRHGVKAFVEKSGELLACGVHLLIVDVLPPGTRDPHGMHALVWEYMSGQEYRPPAGKPLTQAAYEADLAIRAYLEPVAVGDELADMPLFLMPRECVHVPLEQAYATAYGFVPQRWRSVLEAN